ncbi:TPA: hypothetical protein N0F65_010974 [Lagenidium giganteum]|uniref:Sulfite exporter TauE/SafE n=1 Tax=Lagenidium giganteum TaxID=4803 RepID=A0AAV2ZAT0_9STRA|nr:TPA: hypothetical protein N0F65_010974 [Lagenidium giganteum]
MHAMTHPRPLPGRAGGRFATPLVLLLLWWTTAVIAVSASGDGNATTEALIKPTEPSVMQCEQTTDCFSLGVKGLVCRQNVCVSNKLFPLSHEDIVGSIGAFIANILAAGSGLGGGGLLVPTYILTMGLSSHEAIPLSKATIFGSAIASFIINARKKHPLARDRPLIDYETMLLMEPMTLAGTIIGVNMNAIFPEWLITVLIVWLLTKTSLRTLAKGKKIWTEEHAADMAVLNNIVSYWKLLPHQSKFKKFRAVARAYLKWKSYKRAVPVVESEKDISNPQEAEVHMLKSTVLSINDDTDDEDDSEDNEGGSLISSGSKKKAFDDDLPVTLEEVKQHRRSVPWGDLGVLLLTWVGLVLFSLAKGGHGSPSITGLSCGSSGYWSLVGASMPFFMVVTLYFGRRISRVHSMMQSCGYEYAKGDMVWTKRAVIKYPALCTAAGTAAGLLGIGGGMVKGPLLLEMGVLPQVAAATSSSMILFTSSATTIQFIILGTLPVEHALWHGAVGFLAGIIGQFGVGYLIRKYRKTALVIFLIAVVVGVSGGIMGVLGARRIATVGVGGFRSLCTTQ